MDLPYSCRSGSCSTCAAKIVSGDIDMEGEYPKPRRSQGTWRECCCEMLAYNFHSSSMSGK